MGQLTPNHILKVGKGFVFFFKEKGHMPGTSANSVIKEKTPCDSKNGKNTFIEETLDYQLNESKNIIVKWNTKTEHCTECSAKPQRTISAVCAWLLEIQLCSVSYSLSPTATNEC